jgi:ABC-type uncharacterized transport system, periplasmic component
MKKISALLACIAITLTLFSGCSHVKNAPVIGIAQYGEHDSLDNCRKGFLQGLTDAGLKEGTDFTVDYQNAGFDDAADAQIAQTFVSNKVDLMCAIATPSAAACFAAAEGTDIPVVFVAVTDPVKAKLDSGNITGTSDKLPVDAQLEMIRLMQPDADVIGILYTTSEPNSVSAIAEYQEKAPEYGFTIEAIGVTAQSEVTQATDTLISKKVDCLSNLTDNNVVGVLASILEKTNEAKIPVYGSEVTQVEKGCVAAAGIDYVELGKKTGAIAAKILKGEAKAEEIPFESITDYSYYYNSSALAAMSLTLPSSLSDKAIETAAK